MQEIPCSVFSETKFWWYDEYLSLTVFMENSTWRCRGAAIGVKTDPRKYDIHLLCVWDINWECMIKVV